MAVIKGTSQVVKQQIIFPHQNFGWIYIPNLDPGDYSLYVQFKDTKAHLHGFDKLYMSTYGNMACPMLADGKCSRIFDENALVNIPNPIEEGATTKEGENGEAGAANEKAADGADANAGGEAATGAEAGATNPDEAAAAAEAAEKKAEEDAAAQQKAAEEALKQRIDELSAYQWSEEAVPLKDSIYNLLLTLMEVDKKFTAFSSEMTAD